MQKYYLYCVFLRSIALLVLLSGGFSVYASTLKEVMFQAIKNNPTLKAQRAAQKAVLYQENKVTASLLPRLDLSASVFDSNNDNSDLTEYKLLLTQSVYNGGLWTNLEQSEIDKQVALWDYYSTLENLFINVSSIYTNALIAQSELELSQLNLDLSLKNHQVAKKGYELGEKSYLDLVKSEADLVESRANIMNKQDSYQNSLQNLNRHLDSGSQVKSVVEYSLSEFTQPQNKDIDNYQITDLNVEVKSFMYRIQSAKKAIESAEWEYLPNIVFTAEASRRESGSEFVSDTAISEELKFGLQLNWNLFQGFGSEASVDAAMANQQQLKYQLQQRIQDLENEIQQLRNALKQGKRQIESLKTIQTVRENALNVAQRSWELGLVSVSEVLSARVELSKTKQLRYQEFHNYNLNWLKIYQLLGKIDLTQ